MKLVNAIVSTFFLSLWKSSCISFVASQFVQLKNQLKQKRRICTGKHHDVAVSNDLVSTSRYLSKFKRQTDSHWLPLQNFSPENISTRNFTQTYQITRRKQIEKLCDFSFLICNNFSANFVRFRDFRFHSKSQLNNVIFVWTWLNAF